MRAVPDRLPSTLFELRRDKERRDSNVFRPSVANGLAPALESRVYAVYRWVQFRTAFRLRSSSYAATRKGGTPTRSENSQASRMSAAVGVPRSRGVSGLTPVFCLLNSDFLLPRPSLTPTPER